MSSDKYIHSEVENRIYSYWEKNNLFKPKKNNKKFSIVIPPPNVTGSLHMGHALNNSIQDLLTRYHRMNNYETLWQPGTDHAGIATQALVEKKLLKEGIKKDVLGRGGQGIVYRTSDPDIAIKLATIKDSDKPIIDEQEIKKFQRKIQYIRLLPISDEINITKPMAMLKTSAGYVMHLLDEMQPISNMWPNAKNMVENKDVPEWLLEVDKKFANQLIHYQNTGGLRKRLIVLAKCAATISQLHSMGLIYGDISAENLFISKYPDSNEVWLIDPDNISFYKPGKTKGVYTPKYGAPEIVQVKDGCSFNSDCYSFAILAFWIITLNHPFIGKYVTDGGSDWADDTDDDEDLDEKAYAGLLPWIHDEKDDSNHTVNGLPRILVLNEKLTSLFQLTFGVGRRAPWKRPA